MSTKVKRITLVFLGSTGAGPVYSFEMAKALAESNQCMLQVIVSSSSTNINHWKDYFYNHQKAKIIVIDTFKRTTIGVLKTSLFDKAKKQHLVDLIQNFQTDVLYVPFGLLWASYVYKRIYKNIKIITTIHDPHPHNSIFESLKWFIFDTFIGKESIDKVNSIIILNKKDVEYVQNKYHKPVFVIPHASFDYYVKSFDKSTSLKNTFGFIGRIEPYKGLDLLIEAFEKLSNNNLKLIIAGSGSIDSGTYGKIVANNKITLINRYIKDYEFQEIINQLDFIVLPYRRASQSGIIPMCFAFGKTVIATNVGALEEQIPTGTGILVYPNADSISRAISKLYENPQQIFIQGDAAKKYAETELSWTRSVELLLKVL